MMNEQQSIADTVREQSEVKPNGMGILELISRYHDAWQEHLVERNSINCIPDEQVDDHDFNPNDSGPIITSAVAGKTIKDVVIDNEGMDDYLVFNFTDGTSLRVRYDYIYEWSLAASE